MKAIVTLASALLALAIGIGVQNQALAGDPLASTAAVPATSSMKDFDFLEGKWRVQNRRLKVRHVKSNDWDDFPGTLSMHRVLGGLGNVDEAGFPTKGWSGVSLRFFNPKTRQWSIYWVNSRDGLMQEPVVGAFNGNVGEFFGDDVDDGKPIYVRYRWVVADRNHPHWEQAFSLDRGKTWETNWTADFTRVE
jgi:hypothetical protein